MNTIFELVFDTDGIVFTLLGFSKFTLFQFALTRKPRFLFGITLFNMAFGMTKNS